MSQMQTRLISVFGWLNLADYVGSVFTNCLHKSIMSCFLSLDHGNHVNLFCMCWVWLQETCLWPSTVLSWQNFLRLEPSGTLKKGWKTKWTDLLCIQIQAFGWCCRRAAVTAAEGVETKHSGSVWIKTAGLASSDIFELRANICRF